MTYAETTDWLFSQIPNYQLQGASAYKPGLDNIIQLMTQCDHPERKLKFVHIAGTNGKGSVSNMLASVFQACGYKTGLFTSPHLHDFRERIRVNGCMVSEEFVVEFVQKYRRSWETIQPSFFEITTAMAFSHFAQAACDICIVETGLGGRLDSTNIIKPELSIITNIGLDHTAFLGNTLAQIATEKAGIIKESVPIVIGSWSDKTFNVFKDIAASKNAELILAKSAAVFTTDLLGSFQQINLNTTIAAVDRLKKSGWHLPEEKIRYGLAHVAETTGFKARFQKLRENPTVILDAAHNEDGVKIFLNELSHLHFEKLHLIYGAANDKDISSIFSLFPKDAVYYFSEFSSKRTTTLEIMQELANQHSLTASYSKTPQEALQRALSQARQNDLIGIFGSFYLVQEILPVAN